MSDMIKIMAGSASLDFGKRVAAAYGTELVPVTTTRFSDGEFTVSIEETVRGKDVVIVQSTTPPTDNFLNYFFLSTQLRELVLSASLLLCHTLALLVKTERISLELQSEQSCSKHA